MAQFPYLIMLSTVLVLIFITARGVMLVHADRQRRTPLAEVQLPPGFIPPSAALKPPEPKAPRDLSRPYPRPKGGRRKPDSTCPVCGTGDSTGSLDGRVLGWRAHASCAEWLGDWKPKGYVPPPPRQPTGSVTSVSASPGTQINLGDNNRQSAGTSGGTGPSTTVLMTQHGMISLDEARERLNQEIVSNWGVPPIALEIHTHKAGDPVPVERCPKCGAQFIGTPDYLRSAYKTHLQLGCRQS